ncbi:glycosyltransferase family 4 protein [Chloroflexota bacterium]
MRIIHIIDYFQPKLGYQETYLTREHAKAGHDVHIITSDRYNPTIYAGNAAKPMMGKRTVGAGFVTEEGINIWRLKTLFELPHAIWMLGLERKIEELKPDIVIVHGIVNFAAWRIARSKKKLADSRLIYDDHMTFANSRSALKIFYALFRWLFSSSIQKAADALVAILPDSKTFMHQRYGIPDERIHIIPLGADAELFRFDAKARKQTRKEFKLTEEDIVFVYTGKIVPQKKLQLLVEAAAILMTKHDNVKIMLVGGGSQSYIEKLKQDIAQKGLEDKFVWHEAVPNDQLYRIYSAVDVAVWPNEASISMREAMSCGLPLIIGRDSKVTELVDYQNGLLYREGDIADLSQQMEKLLDPELRREMGHKSRKLVDDRFNWRTIAEQFIGLVTV